jgi:Protein of unknown function (DUF4089)
MTNEIHSVDLDAYVEMMAAMIGLPIAAPHRKATVAQLKLNVVIAKPLLAFEIPEGTNPAPVFKP